MAEYIMKKEICGTFHAKCGIWRKFSGLSHEMRDRWSPYLWRQYTNHYGTSCLSIHLSCLSANRTVIFQWTYVLFVLPSELFDISLDECGVKNASGTFVYPAEHIFPLLLWNKEGRGSITQWKLHNLYVDVGLQDGNTLWTCR
jgi:hypothetical protein